VCHNYHGLSDVDTCNTVSVFAQFEAQATSAATKFENPARVDGKQGKVEGGVSFAAGLKFGQ
jgi:hypothetical protein